MRDLIAILISVISGILMLYCTACMMTELVRLYEANQVKINKVQIDCYEDLRQYSRLSLDRVKEICFK